MFAGQLVAAVHGRRGHELVFANEGVRGLDFQIRETVDGDGRAEHDLHADVVFLGLLHGTVKNAHGAHNVNVAGLGGNAFRAGGEQRGQMVDLVEIVIREDIVDAFFAHEVKPVSFFDHRDKRRVEIVEV